MSEDQQRAQSGRRRRVRRSSVGKKRVLPAAAFLVAIAAGVAGAIFLLRASDSLVEPSAPVPTAALQLNAALGPKFGAEIVATSSKLFQRVGVAVDVRPAASNADPIVQVVSGKATIGVADSIGFLLARAKGEPIVAFAANYLESAIVFYALERSGIHSPQDFVGKRVGRKADTREAIVYDALLKKVGLSRSQIAESATDTNLDALLSGKVDVIAGQVGKEGFILRQKGVPFTTVRVSDYGIHIPETVYFTTEAMMRDRPSVVQRFLDAIIGGWTMIYANPAKHIPVILAAAGHTYTAEQIEFELAAQRDFVMPLGRRVAEFDPEQWKQLAAILTSARLIDGSSLDLSRAIDYELLKEAYRKPISFGN